MFKREAQIQRLDWAASQMVQRELPYTVLRGLFLKLILTTTNGAAAALTALQLASVISEVRVRINGSDTRKALSGEWLWIMNYNDFSKSPEASIDTGLGSGRTQSITLYLPAALTRAVRPSDTVLDLRKLPPMNPVSTATLEVQFGAAAIGTDMVVTSGYVNIQSVEYTGKDLEGVRPWQAIHEFSHVLFPVSVTGVNRIMVETGGVNEYRRFFVATKNAAGAYSNDQISSIAVRAREYTWIETASDLIQDMNAQQFSISPLTGVYIIDFCTDGLMSERLDAKGLGELTIEPNVLLAGGTIFLLKEKVFYIPKS